MSLEQMVKNAFNCQMHVIIRRLYKLMSFWIDFQLVFSFYPLTLGSMSFLRYRTRVENSRSESVKHLVNNKLISTRRETYDPFFAIAWITYKKFIVNSYHDSLFGRQVKIRSFLTRFVSRVIFHLLTQKQTVQYICFRMAKSYILNFIIS